MQQTISRMNYFPTAKTLRHIAYVTENSKFQFSDSITSYAYVIDKKSIIHAIFTNQIQRETIGMCARIQIRNFRNLIHSTTQTNWFI
jgi:hypothetical protein